MGQRRAILFGALTRIEIGEQGSRARYERPTRILAFSLFPFERRRSVRELRRAVARLPVRHHGRRVLIRFPRLGRATSRFGARLSHWPLATFGIADCLRRHVIHAAKTITNRRGARLDRTRLRGTRTSASIPTATTRRPHRVFA